ncbi:MAG: MBL fold metallo-hydrolase [Lachnospiraceae bacterium]|nr:MBL fold metallo-hydrolase [Lachnospiraceae bacterium]
MKMARMAVGPLGVNCYIVYNEETKKAFIVDPGGDAKRIIQKIESMELEVEAILLTHGHFDHILGVDELRKHFGVKVYLGENDSELIQDGERNISAMFGRPFATKADVMLKDGQELTLAGINIQVIGTPGHTPGGVSYYLKDEEIAFSGDSLFQGSIGRTDFPDGSASTLVASIKTKLLTLPGDTQLFPGHGDSTVVEYEKQYNPFL